MSEDNQKILIIGAITVGMALAGVKPVYLVLLLIFLL